jgi:hypothetical protein
MAVARVVEFDGVSKDRMDGMRAQMEGQEQPEGLNASEILVLHDADAEKAVVVVFFESEEDYQQGDAVLNAMPTEDTPGARSSVKKYDVAHRETA